MCNCEQEITTLKARIKELEGGKEWPHIDGIYYHMELGNVSKSYWMNDAIDDHRRDFLGVFRTKEEAEKKLALVEALVPAKRWRPRSGETFWTIEDIPTQLVWVDDSPWLMNRLMTGNVHATREHVEEYGRALKEAYEAGL